MADPITVTVLGSGTSSGVPLIGCDCATCTSEDPRDQRLRPSILVQYGGRNILVDTTPDFRQQALRTRLRHIDAILYTHGHADHLMGFDDIRVYNFLQNGPLSVHGFEDTLSILRQCFSYVFEARSVYTFIPKVELTTLSEEPFELCGMPVIPIRLIHGRGITHGYRFGNFAYLTDHSDIPDESLALLHGLDTLFLDALRYKPHPTHSTVEQSLRYVEQLAPRRAYFTHICHDLLHARAEEMLPPHVRLAYDGLKIAIEPSPA